MKKIIMFARFQPGASRLVVAVITAFVLSACSGVTRQALLSDPPTTLDKHFGSSVARMIELQSRPTVADEPGAGYQLEGWEAERILDSYGKSD